jgi:hypothetical protein
MKNAAAFLMPNGTPCFIHDGDFDQVREVRFCRDDHLVSLVWSGGVERMEYPLSEHILQNLLRLGIAAVGRMGADRRVQDLHVMPVVCIDA